MKRLALLLVAGAMAVMLVACGQEAPKKPEVQSPAATEQPAAPAAAPAAPAAPQAGAESQE